MHVFGVLPLVGGRPLACRRLPSYGGGKECRKADYCGGGGCDGGDVTALDIATSITTTTTIATAYGGGGGDAGRVSNQDGCGHGIVAGGDA